jgi:hypothetical protein
MNGMLRLRKLLFGYGYKNGGYNSISPVKLINEATAPKSDTIQCLRLTANMPPTMDSTLEISQISLSPKRMEIVPMETAPAISELKPGSMKSIVRE